VLRDVRDVARRPGHLVEVARAVAAELVDAHPSDMDEGDVQDAARLIEWLVDGRFALLGHRLHDYRDEHPAGSGLGLLRREEAAGRVLDGVALDPSEDGDILVLTRAGTASRVFRPVHPSVLAVRITDRTGRAVREHHFLGALTRAALHEDVLAIPRIGRRVRASVHRAGVHLESYTGQRMLEVIAEYPREELFWAGDELLHDLATGVPALTQPRRLRLIVDREPFGRFYSCLVYLPRDRYSTHARRAMEEVLLRELHGWRIEHAARIGSESRLATVHFTVYPKAGGSTGPGPAAGQARRRNPDVGRVGPRRRGSHDAEVVDQLDGVPEAYKGDVDPVQALADLRTIRFLEKEPETPAIGRAGPDRCRDEIAVLPRRPCVTLSAVLPVLHAWDGGARRAALRVRPAGRWPAAGSTPSDCGRRGDERRDTARGRSPVPELFCAAFAAAWRGEAETDGFSALVLRTGLAWREVAVLRGYARYARQLGQPLRVNYMADTLLAHPRRGQGAAGPVHRAFDPALRGRPGVEDDALATAQELIDAVTGLDADRILRGFLGMIGATLRTNFYRGRPFLSFKIDPSAVPDMPAPRPRFEIFVYSPRVEGVHLRYGPVARGGLRWSDRPQDFRTEILGLVKAQAVKNAVIVPVGAKGGFVVRRPEAGGEEVVACYRTFICGLLDVTDNLVTRPDGRAETVPPPDVVRHDGDDAYLVVAADKGTATFSDIANEVAASYGFWLGDAFASAGRRVMTTRRWASRPGARGRA
jgi:glutamate dehydrogenase